MASRPLCHWLPQAQHRSGTNNAIAELVAILSSMQVLLVFDNCDGLLGDDTMETWQDMLGRILSSGLGVKAIVTSRNDVNPVGVERYKIDVDKLSPDAAVHLLSRNKGNMDPALLAKLAEQCGYFPLALRVLSRCLSNRKCV